MAELVVKSRCSSALRQILDTAINTTFPLWGILSPFVMLCILINSVYGIQERNVEKIFENAVAVAILVCVIIFPILLKRLLSNDFMILDKEGITLPRFFCNGITLRRFIPWKSIDNISAVISSEDINRSQLLFTRSRGKSIQLPLSKIRPEFIEQFLLAANMWAPAVCDKNLDELQTGLRIGARNAEQRSYTDLWDDELNRRFCPTAYIPLEPGRLVRGNSVKVINHLASGGLSALYLCQRNGKDLVVLKEATIPATGVESIREKAKELFDREAKLLMKIDHPGIVHVLDCFSESERNYLLLEYINGTDLRQLVAQNGPQKEPDVLEWAIQIATAVKYLHEREQPIIHRDLTPDNMVLRNDGKVVLVDFGAANEYIGNATGTFVGKHSFIAPEQLRGKANTQSDIYAFGCTLFYLLVGTEPEALLPSNLKLSLPTISDELSELVQSCTQLEASDRPQSIAQVLPVLRRLAAQSLVL